MSVSILVVDDEPDVAELFRQRFRRETRQGRYVIHELPWKADSNGPAGDRRATECGVNWNSFAGDVGEPALDRPRHLLSNHRRSRLAEKALELSVACGDEALAIEYRSCPVGWHILFLQQRRQDLRS